MGDKVGENPAVLRAAVFLLSAKIAGVGVQTPPSRAKVNTGSQLIMPHHLAKVRHDFGCVFNGR